VIDIVPMLNGQYEQTRIAALKVAADEIVRLRKALSDIVEMRNSEPYSADRAADALGGGDGC
jgi:hypothetical protein